jgi:hypothetical protein
MSQLFQMLDLLPTCFIMTTLELSIYVRVTMLGVKSVRYTSRAVDFEHSETTFCKGCK